MAEFMLPPQPLNESLQQRWQSKKSKRESGIKKKSWDEKTESVFLTFCPGKSEPDEESHTHVK